MLRDVAAYYGDERPGRSDKRIVAAVASNSPIWICHPCNRLPWKPGSKDHVWSPSGASNDWISIAISKSNDKFIIIAAPKRGHLCISDDVGVNWRWITDIPEQNWRSVSAGSNPLSPVASIVAVSFESVWISVDAGLTWNNDNSVNHVQSVAIANRPGFLGKGSPIIYAAASGGFGGNIWVQDMNEKSRPSQAMEYLSDERRKMVQNWIDKKSWVLEDAAWRISVNRDFWIRALGTETHLEDSYDAGGNPAFRDAFEWVLSQVQKGIQQKGIEDFDVLFRSLSYADYQKAGQVRRPYYEDIHYLAILEIKARREDEFRVEVFQAGLKLNSHRLWEESIMFRFVHEVGLTSARSMLTEVYVKWLTECNNLDEAYKSLDILRKSLDFYDVEERDHSYLKERASIVSKLIPKVTRVLDTQLAQTRRQFNAFLSAHEFDKAQKLLDDMPQYDKTQEFLRDFSQGSAKEKMSHQLKEAKAEYGNPWDFLKSFRHSLLMVCLCGAIIIMMYFILISFSDILQ